MTQFQKKPIVVDAACFTDEDAAIEEIKTLVGGEWTDTDPPEQGKHSLVEGRLKLWNSEESQHIQVPAGHWVIKGVNGEVYPCSDDVLQQTYDRVE